MVSLSRYNLTLVERMDLVMPPLKDMSQNNDELSPPPSNAAGMMDRRRVSTSSITWSSLSLSLSLILQRTGGRRRAV